MLAMEVVINGKKSCVAGVDHLNLLSAMLYWHRARGWWELEVQGMTDEKGHDEHIRWISRKLRLGDTLNIKVIETKKSSKPKKRYKAK